MKLNNERYQWIYDNLDAFKRALVTKDFCESRGLSRLDDKAFHKADDIVHSLALSFLLVAMGDHIPKEMWTVDDILENAPTIDAQPVKHGKWVRDASGELNCSYCGYAPKWDDDKFCANCGAKMDGGDADGNQC